jgi:hypothetical protein
VAAADVTGIPVGWDPEFECATFDSDDLNEAQLQAGVFEGLGGIDPSWQAHLKLAE